MNCKERKRSHLRKFRFLKPMALLAIGAFEAAAPAPASAQVVINGITVSYDGVHGILNIIGTSGADTIHLTTANNQVFLNGKLALPILPPSIFISAMAGNDTITLDIATPCVVWAGAGDDIVLGSSVDDELYGNLGNDQLNGRAGDDYLEGDDGDDLLQGGPGQDQLLGQNGNDTVSGDLDYDTVSGGSGRDTFYLGYWTIVGAGPGWGSVTYAYDLIDYNPYQDVQGDPSSPGWAAYGYY